MRWHADPGEFKENPGFPAPPEAGGTILTGSARVKNTKLCMKLLKLRRYSKWSGRVGRLSAAPHKRQSARGQAGAPAAVAMLRCCGRERACVASPRTDGSRGRS